MKKKNLVLDANILMRAVLGKSVVPLLLEHHNHINFYTPNVCYQDAERHLPTVLKRQKQLTDSALTTLQSLTKLISFIDSDMYQSYADEAQKRIPSDLEDWPIVACALLLNCPIWTEDKHFFGTGIPIWASDRISLYLKKN